MLNGLNPLIAFLAGLASFVSPCVLPLVPAYLAYLGARRAGADSIAVAGAAFVAGLSLVFIFFFYLFSLAVQPIRAYDVEAPRLGQSREQHARDALRQPRGVVSAREIVEIHDGDGWTSRSSASYRHFGRTAPARSCKYSGDCTKQRDERKGSRPRAHESLFNAGDGRAGTAAGHLRLHRFERRADLIRLLVTLACIFREAAPDNLLHSRRYGGRHRRHRLT